MITLFFIEEIKSKLSTESEMGHWCDELYEKSEWYDGKKPIGQMTEMLGVGLDEGFIKLNWLPMKKCLEL